MTTDEVPMPKPPVVGRLMGKDVCMFADAIAYADARCAKLQAALAISEDMGKRAMEGIAFAHKFNEAMGNEMRAAGCVFDTEAMKVRNERAEKAEAERDALAEKVKAMEDNDRRYRWLRDQFETYITRGNRAVAGFFLKDDYEIPDGTVGDRDAKFDAAIDAAGGVNDEP